MKLVTILGARPQFIKAAALSRLIFKDEGIREVMVHTGQHYDHNMSDIFFSQMGIPAPDYHLGIKSVRHGQMTGLMLERIEDVLIREKPEVVVVYGDTNSTLAGSLAAKKLQLKVAHIEAGLRSFNMKMPEEINRILTDRISDVLFCPSSVAVNNLHQEGFEKMSVKIHNVGDIMKDVALYYKDKSIKPSFNVPEQFVLATIHRAENTDEDERLLNILNALKILSKDIPVILPLHPRTRTRLSNLRFEPGEHFSICDPVGYLEMVCLLNSCQLVVTDSGGLQKEAFYFNKYCVTIRDETEWTELVTMDYNRIAGADSDRIITYSNYFLAKSAKFDKNLYGDGTAAQKILNVLKSKNF